MERFWSLYKSFKTKKYVEKNFQEKVFITAPN